MERHQGSMKVSMVHAGTEAEGRVDHTEGRREACTSGAALSAAGTEKQKMRRDTSMWTDVSTECVTCLSKWSI